jgi:hypothetical protein
MGELVAGLDAIATQPIPYGKLPARARTVYGPRYATWCDIADTTIADLLKYRSSGVRTVESIVMAARAAVNQLEESADRPQPTLADALDRLLDDLGERDRKVLCAREWGSEQVAQERLAAELDVSPTWLWRNEGRIRSRFAELLNEPSHAQIRQSADELRRRLGVYVPGTTVESEIHQFALDPTSEAARVLLYVAGPYKEHGDWFEDTPRGGRKRVDASVRRLVRAEPAPTLRTLTQELTAEGMRREVVPAYLDTLALSRIGRAYLPLHSGLRDKISAVLHETGQPMTAEEIVSVIGYAVGAKSVLKALHGNARFVRTSRTRWALAAWNLPEYGGIAHEITARIEAAGGRVRVSELLDDMLRAFPDVKESSIRTYLATLAFVTESGMVRCRRPEDLWPSIPSLDTVPGASRQPDGCVRIAIPVTTHVLRGSGLSIDPPVAEAVGVTPGSSRDFETACGAVSIAWALAEPAAPNMGSIRLLARAAGAGLGDSLALIFDPDQGALYADCVQESVMG